jgi:hypothetical protein
MKHILSLWPTVKDLSDDLGLPYTTVHSWAARGRVPASHDLALIRAASSRGHSLTLEELHTARAESLLCAKSMQRNMRNDARKIKGAA